MKNYFRLMAVVIASFLGQEGKAQVDNSADKDVNTVQLSVMIVPFRKEGQEYRKLYDNSKTIQYAIDKLKEGFDDRGYQVIDFVSAYDNAMADGTIQGITNQDDALAVIARHSNSDILITVDVSQEIGDLGNKAYVRMNASDASTNYAYGTKVCESPYFNTKDSMGLVRRAMSDPDKPAIPDFLNKLQSSFTSLRQKGRPLKIVFGLGKNSMLTFSSKLPSGKTMSVAINDFIKSAAYKNYSQMQSASNISMVYSDVRVPIKDSQGLNYSPFDFGNKVVTFLNTEKLKVDQPYMRSGALYVTIN